MDNQQDRHNRTDEQLQQEQNALIERNTKITIWLGISAIIAQIIDTVAHLLK